MARKGSGGFYFAAVFLRYGLCRVVPPLRVLDSGSCDNAPASRQRTVTSPHHSFVLRGFSRGYSCAVEARGEGNPAKGESDDAKEGRKR